MHQLVLDCNIPFDIDIGHDYAFFWASKKRCDTYNVIMEQLHPLPNRLKSSIKIKHLAVKHYYSLFYSILTVKSILSLIWNDKLSDWSKKLLDFKNVLIEFTLLSWRSSPRDRDRFFNCGCLVKHNVIIWNKIYLCLSVHLLSLNGVWGINGTG